MRPGRIVALAAVAPVVALVGLAVLDPGLTAQLVEEEGPIEWTQSALCAVAAVLALLRARAEARLGRSPAFDLLIASTLATLAVGELELDRWLFGTKVIGTRFFLNPRKPVAWPWRLLTALIVVGVPAAVAVYALARLRTVVAAGAEAVGQAWGQGLLAGVVLFGASQALEPLLDRVEVVSPFFLEETAELAASACFVIAYVVRPAATRAPALRR